MKITPLALEGVLLVELKLFEDNRGFFTETFQSSRFRAAGLPGQFAQTNWSRSKPGVVRGLHYQFHPDAIGDWTRTQGKLVTCIRGAIQDIIVDVRPKSPTFGQHVSIELPGGSGKMVWIPSGFLHGFCALDTVAGEPTDVIYQVDCQYDPKGDGGVCWNDPKLGIHWPVKSPVVSDKDQVLPTWDEFLKTLKSGNTQQ